MHALGQPFDQIRIEVGAGLRTKRVYDAKAHTGSFGHSACKLVVKLWFDKEAGHIMVLDGPFDHGNARRSG